MELPRRARGDELLRAGELLGVRERVRRLGRGHDLATVIACAFDHRTRMLPFIYADTRMAPAGVRAIGSAMVDAGFERTRIVLQQWNRNFRPSRMRLDGRVPDLFMVSTMGMHSERAMELMSRPVCMTSNIQSVLFVPDTLDLYVANADGKNVASHTRFTKYNLHELLTDKQQPSAAAR